MKRLLIIATSALALAAAPAAAQTMAISGVNLAMGDGSEPIENGAVVVENGKVTYAGPASGMPAVAMPLVEAPTGTWVTPGLFATVTTLGLSDVGAVSDSNDTRVGDSPFNAALDVSRAINPDSQHIKIHRAAGVTRATAMMAGTRSIFGGQGAVIDLGADPDAVTVPLAFQTVELGETGASRAGGSRVATYAEFANALREAREAANGRWDADTAMLTRADAEALVPVVTGRQKLYVMVERAADIRGVLGLKREYRALDLVLVGASEGWLVAREIAAAGIPVIADGLDDLPSGFDQLASTQSNIGRMVSAGVKVAINAASMTNPRNLNQFAGNLVALTRVPGASGLSWGQAFAAISSIPAEISGMGGQAGVLAPGAAGDIVIWDGDPLEVGSVPTRVYIDGVAQPLENHQSRLRDRYRDLDESDLPKAYDW